MKICVFVFLIFLWFRFFSSCFLRFRFFCCVFAFSCKSFSFLQLGSNETLRVRANAVLTHTSMRAHAFAFASNRKRVSPRRCALLAKKSLANAYRPHMRATNQNAWSILNSSNDIRFMFRHDIIIL